MERNINTDRLSFERTDGYNTSQSFRDMSKQRRTGGGIQSYKHEIAGGGGNKGKLTALAHETWPDSSAAEGNKGSQAEAGQV